MAGLFDSTNKQIFTWMQGQIIQANGTPCSLLTPRTTTWLGMSAPATVKLLLVLVIFYLSLSLYQSYLIVNLNLNLPVADHFDKVIATDISEAQLKVAMQHPKVHYHHTPPSISDDDLLALLGGENSLDLITVAQAIHWFDLPNFYSLANRLLRKPGGIIAVWCYNDIVVSPTFDPIMKQFHNTTLPYWNPRINYLFDGYATLPFPFETVGTLSRPLELDIPKHLSFQGFLRMVGSWSAVVTAKEQGVDLLNEGMVRRLETAWGGSALVNSIAYKAFMLLGKVKINVIN